MKLSIIIACFNAADTIATQLEALAQQQWSEPWEIIIADNGSTDGSLDIIRQYHEQLPNLRIVDASQRRGAAYARNLGASVATGMSLAFCDADDEVASDWIATMGDALKKYDFVACRFDPHKLNDPTLVKARDCPQQNGLQQRREFTFLPYAGGGGLGIKRSIHEAVGGFDGDVLYLEDTDYCWKVQLAGTPLHFVPEAVLHVRYRPTSSAMYSQSRRWAECDVFLYKKYRQLGMPILPWKTGIRAWIDIFKTLPQAFNQETHSKWMWNFAWRLGRLRGSIKYKVWAL